MSKRKILLELKGKGIPVVSVEYLRGQPTPYGYANGWNVVITEDTQNRLFSKGFFNCAGINERGEMSDVIKWVDSMPSLKESKEG